MTILVSLDGQPIEAQGNIALTTVGVPPVPGELDTSFEQGEGFNAGANGIFENDGKYYVAGPGGGYSAYNGISSVNANIIKHFLRVDKTTLLPDSYSLLGESINGTSGSIGGNKKVAISGGYVYITGSFTTYKGNVARGIVRINESDMSFSLGNTGVGYSIGISAYGIYCLGGKIFLTTSSSVTYNGGPSTRLHVLNLDLTLDSTLTNQLLPNGVVNAIFLQADGKIIMTGAFTTIGGVAYNRIIRLNSDFTVDTAFTTNIGTGPSSTIEEVRQLSTGELILGGQFTTFNGTSSQRIIKLNLDGTLNTAVASGFNSTVRSMRIDGSDNIYCGGLFASYGGTTRTYYAKLNSSLVLDGTFNPTISASAGYAIELDGNNLYISPGVGTVNGVSCRGLATIDATTGATINNFFGGINQGGEPTGNVMTIYLSGNYLYIVGSFYNYAKNYAFDGERIKHVTILTKQGKIIKSLDKHINSTGTITTYNMLFSGTSSYHISNQDYYGPVATTISRFINDSFDATYISTVGSTTYGIYDNGIILCGFFTSPKNRIVKIDTSGAVDSSFDVGTGFNQRCNFLLKLSSGKYIACGDFTTYKGVTQNRIVRLNTDGSVDTAFVVGTGPNIGPTGVLELSNGNYLLWQDGLTSWKGVSCKKIIQVTPTGDLVDWLPNNFTGTPTSVVEYNGKLYVGGSALSAYGSTSIYNIVCLDLATGNIIDIFGTGFGNSTSNYVSQLMIDSDGKLVAVGYFTSYNGTPVGRIARIHI